MLRRLLTVTAIVLCTGAGPQGDIVADLLSGRADPLTFDYGALRERPGADAFLKDAESRAKREVLRRHGIADDISWDDANIIGCRSEQEIAVLKGLSSAAKVKTAAEWQAARVQAVEAEARRQAVRQTIFNGEPSPYEQLRGVERRLKWAREAKDPAVAELFRRNAQDNFSRWSFGFSARQFMAQDLSDAALDLYDAKVEQETCLVDQFNRTWLKETIARRGWFRISVDGEKASDAAFNMIQHADDDVAFQQAMLALVEKEVAAKEASPSNYAYLWDRVAVNTGKPQRYATQGTCHGPGDWRPNTLEDPANVDARRTAYGIDWPLKDYIARMNTYCR